MNIIDSLLKELQIAVKSVYSEELTSKLKISSPPDISMGIFAIECFPLAKQFKKAPALIAKELTSKLNEKSSSNSFKAIGPYINVTVNPNELFQEVFQTKEHVQTKNSKTIMVEYLSPNTNKPLHLGHMRNGTIAMAISSVLKYVGHQVVKANLVNDRGIHICKSMLAWKKFGNGATAESTGKKGDHFVGDYYVLFNEKVKEDPSLLTEAQELLQKWENGDEETIKLWNEMNSAVYSGFDETYKALGFQFDVEYFESDLYKAGKDIVMKGLKKGIFQQEPNGTIVFLLPEKEFGVNKDGSQKKVTLLRANGTSVYVTQDLAVAEKKASDFKLDSSFYVVGKEQTYYFKTLFSIFEALGYSWAPQSEHLSYGMVELPGGKMKSREGTVVDADDLVNEVTDLAAAAIMKNQDKTLSDEILEQAKKIGIGAIKFFLLKTNPKSKITFDPKESISFDGVTGPYIQYAYARSMGVKEKAELHGISEATSNFSLLGNNNEEQLLAQKLFFFQSKIKKAAELLNVSIIANALYDLAKAFHQFYNKHTIIGKDKELSSQRLTLVMSTAKMIKFGLELLGIETLNKM